MNLLVLRQYYMLLVLSSVPQEAPHIVSTSTTSTSVHVSWTSPFFVGAPLIGYRLSVSTADGSAQRPADSAGRPMEKVMEVLVSSTAIQQVMSEVVTLLQPDTNYQVNVSALNQFGAGIPATVTVHTLPNNVGESSNTPTSNIVSPLYGNSQARNFVA